MGEPDMMNVMDWSPSAIFIGLLFGVFVLAPLFEKWQEWVREQKDDELKEAGKAGRKRGGAADE